MTHFPPSALHEKRRVILRRVGLTLSALMVLLVLTVFGAILLQENAYDEQTCPFEPLGEQSFAGGRVLEQRRTCGIEGLPAWLQPRGTEERRYLVERPGAAPYELARKRVASRFFEEQRYTWKLELDEQKRLRLSILIDGKLSSEFREEDRATP